MQNYRKGKWVDQILSQRQEDGLWGKFHTLSCRVTVVMIVQSVLHISQRKPIMMICADRHRVFIKRGLNLIFLLINSIATVADQKTCLSYVRNVLSKSVALSMV